MESSILDLILARGEAKVNRHSFSTWFKPTAFVADGGRSITVRVPNTLFKDWLTKHYSVVLAEALAEVRRSESSLHVRHVHRRALESVRACGMSCGCGSAVAIVQPAFHLRWRGSGQDAPD